MLLLIAESEADLSSRRMMSMLLLQNNEPLIKELMRKHPWTVQFTSYGNAGHHVQFGRDVPTMPEPFPLSRRHRCKSFIKDTLAHFAGAMSAYILESWDVPTLTSGNTAGALRALIFASMNAEQRRALANLLFEFKAIRAMREWTGRTADPSTCPAARRFFWRVAHCYAGMRADFDRGATVAEWDRRWFNEALAARRADAVLGVMRALVARTVRDCDALLQEREGLFLRRRQLVAQLRTAVIGRPRCEIRIIKTVLDKVQGCHEMDTLARGVPMPPFDLGRSRAVLDEAERLLIMADFVDGDLVTTVSGAPPAAPAAAREEEAGSSSSSLAPAADIIDSLMESVSANFRTDNVLTDLLLFGPDVSAAHAPVGGGPAALWGAALETLRETEALRRGVVQAAVELQAEREEQRRRAVRREVKRIRLLLKQVVAFAVAQQGEQGALEMRRRAKGLEAEIRGLLGEAGRLRQCLDECRSQQAALLAQHALEQRRRRFLAIAPHFLPSAMFEPEMECGMCLTGLDWNADPRIGFVTCCLGLGYVCGGCLARPHGAGHGLVVEFEIVRSVRGARRALGI